MEKWETNFLFRFLFFVCLPSIMVKLLIIKELVIRLQAHIR